LLERELLKFIFEKARLSSPNCFPIPLVAQLSVGREYLSILYVLYSPDAYFQTCNNENEDQRNRQVIW
jgi:hypothetical protein